jgi:hypothetical protein
MIQMNLSDYVHTQNHIFVKSSIILPINREIVESTIVDYFFYRFSSGGTHSAALGFLLHCFIVALAGQRKPISVVRVRR